MEKIKKKYRYLILLFVILILPFSFSQRNDPINAKPINDSTVGYYQSTTCKISLFEYPKMFVPTPIKQKSLNIFPSRYQIL